MEKLLKVKLSNFCLKEKPTRQKPTKMELQHCP